MPGSRVYPDDLATARGFLKGFQPEFANRCIGTISEIFDAEPPFTAAGLRRTGLECR